MKQEAKSYRRTLFEDFMLRLAIKFKEQAEVSDKEKDETENCIGTVIFTWTYLEGYINYFINDEMRRFLKDIKPEYFNKMPTIRKYIFLSKMISGETFVKGEEPLESFLLLNKIRNKLIHYEGKMEEVGEHIQPKKLVRQCSNKFKIRSIEIDSLRKVLTKECADWCLKTVIRTVYKFHINIYGKDVHLPFKGSEFEPLKKYLSL